MSRAVIKNARYKYGLIFCSLIVTFCVLIKIEGFDELGAARVILGGYPLGRTILILTFVINVSLIQYLNADQMVLMLKKNELLLIRYGKPKKLLCQGTADMRIFLAGTSDFDHTAKRGQHIYGHAGIFCPVRIFVTH